jgi:hypothetical protein
MKKSLGFLLGAIVLTAPLVWARMDTRSQGNSMNMTRACVPKIGDVALTLEATTSTDADSGALNAGSMYMLRCDTDAWIRFGAAAVTAAADDWLVGANEVFFIPTGGSENMVHISALSKDSNGDCRLIECL